MCELSDGSLLGAVKFQTTLPWELDADLRIWPNDFPVLENKSFEVFKNNGYTIVSLWFFTWLVRSRGTGLFMFALFVFRT